MQNLPSFAARLDVPLEVEGLGRLTVDTAYGGDSFVVVDAAAMGFSLEAHLVLLCGRYRGIDERIRQLYVTDEISVGDYVLSGGELPALVLIDAVVRLIPGAMGDAESALEDSFQNGLLDCPWYTRPQVFEGLPVPEVLLGGNHRLIAEWRREEAMKRTRERRPDLLDENNSK